MREDHDQLNTLITTTFKHRGGTTIRIAQCSVFVFYWLEVP